MQEKLLFEYAVVRIVPRVEREEFLNAGVIVYCSAKRFLQMRYVIKQDRLAACCADLDMQEMEARLKAIESICAGSKDGGTIGALPLASRFRWLTATRSTIVQTSPVHPGLCIDPLETLDRLFKELVL